ncbi:hypothetical protein EJO66_31115 [Variovorax beijingensis]|uniref:Transglycosylase SLT domain-containing protein n=1 Tax=Variovorax beijingensis TaxID=2496117 RepID=A0ABX9ZXM2_9BURK|nr:hypothetical protein [Variovorax beijingensis]RSZ28798.1 hypothetical protein EJO66_31115 [Variovorax beijingensis]
MPQPLKFYEMFNLTGQRIRNEPSDLIGEKYNQELFIAIFWEETFFRNMVQDSGWDAGRAVGFGQVQWALVNKLMGTHYQQPKQAVLADDELSVDVAIKAILETDRMTKGNKLAALKRYAGGKTPPWMATSDALKKIPEIGNYWEISETDAAKNKGAIVAALELTRKDAIISKLF